MGVGRLHNCTVCSGARCGENGTPGTRTLVTGQYRLNETVGVADASRALLLPGDDCLDRITGVNPVLSSVRCGTSVCSGLTDVQSELVEAHGLSAFNASAILSRGLLGLAPAYMLDVGSVDPTTAPTVAGISGHASVLLGLGMRVNDVWEWLACGLIDAATLREQRNSTSARAAASSIASATTLMGLRGLRGSSGSRINGTRLVNSQLTNLASDGNGSTSSDSSDGTSGDSTGDDSGFNSSTLLQPTALNAQVAALMRRHLAAHVASGYNLSAAAALSPEGGAKIAKLFSAATLSTAATVGVRSLTPDDVAAPSAALVSLLAAMSEALSADLSNVYTPVGVITGASETVTNDEWYAAQATLALASFESRALVQWSEELLLSDSVTLAMYTDATEHQAFVERMRDSAARLPTGLVLGQDGSALSILCLDPTAATYSPKGALHQQSQCLYARSKVGNALLSMDDYQWGVFSIQLVSALWLILTCGASLTFLLWVQPRLRTTNAKPVDKWPHIAVLVPCYMPNEQGIIEETLERITEGCSYLGRMDVHVPYNTPHALPVEQSLAKVGERHGHKMSYARVPGSTSKAHNLEYAMEHMVGDAEIIVIFDADHHPRASTIEHLVRTLVHNPHLSAAQGAVLVERGGYSWLQVIVDGMEWASWHHHGPGIALLVGSAYFGGGNAAWRKDAITKLGFDANMLTEDIDVSIRALAQGHRMQFVPWAQVGELCPATLAGFYKQRLRWAMGWEQVTARRLSVLFSSTVIPESRKWRTMILLISRYWSISTALFSSGNMLRDQIYHTEKPLPIVATSAAAGFVTIMTISALLLSLFLNREPFWRWLHVLLFLPISMFYLAWQAVIIVVSWFKLACCSLEWVPTARQLGDETHHIKMSEKEHGEKER